MKQLREMRMDQYGMRTIIEVDGSPIKFEVLHADDGTTRAGSGPHSQTQAGVDCREAATTLSGRRA